MVAADQRVDVAFAGFCVEVDTVFRQGAFLGFTLRLFTAADGLRRLFVIGARNRAAFAERRIFGNAMGDEVHGVIAGHVLLLQEVGRIAFAFGKDRHQNVGAGHFGAAGALHVDCGALDHALEGGGRHRFGSVDVGDQVGQIVVHKLHQGGAQFPKVDAAGAHHAGGIGFVDQRQQQMLQRCEFVAPLVCQRKRGMNGLFQCARE